MELYLSKSIDNQDKLYSEIATITEEERMIEYIMLKLRMEIGINHSDFEKKFSEVFDSKFKNLLNLLNTNLLIDSNLKNTSLTNKGKLVSDYIFTKFAEEINL